MTVTIYYAGEPQFYGTFSHSIDAERYADMWRELAARSRLNIRIQIDD